MVCTALKKFSISVKASFLYGKQRLIIGYQERKSNFDTLIIKIPLRNLNLQILLQQKENILTFEEDS